MIPVDQFRREFLFKKRGHCMKILRGVTDAIPNKLSIDSIKPSPNTH